VNPPFVLASSFSYIRCVAGPDCSHHWSPYLCAFFVDTRPFPHPDGGSAPSGIMPNFPFFFRFFLFAITQFSFLCWMATCAMRTLPCTFMRFGPPPTKRTPLVRLPLTTAKPFSFCLRTTSGRISFRVTPLFSWHFVPGVRASAGLVQPPLGFL